MTITLPSYVAPNELIQSAWGNAVVNALDELDDEKANLAGATFTGAVIGITPTAASHLTRKDYVDNKFVELAGDEMTGALTVNHPSSGTSVILKAGDEIPRLRWQSQAGTDLASMIASSSALTIDTLSSNPIRINAPTEIEMGSGSQVLTLQAVTETPLLDLQSTAGTSLLTLTAGVATSTISAFDDLKLRTNGSDAVTVDGGTQNVTLAAGLTVTNTLTASSTLTMGGALDHNGTTVGFYGVAPTTRQTGYTTFANLVTDRTCDANTVVIAELADIVGTLIEDLKATGIIGA